MININIPTLDQIKEISVKTPSEGGFEINFFNFYGKEFRITCIKRTKTFSLFIGKTHINTYGFNKRDYSEFYNAVKAEINHNVSLFKYALERNKQLDFDIHIKEEV